MERTIIKIDETLCDGCGLCVNGCHEGALQLIDGKAVMISELYCDGLGACIGECPVGAITLEQREAEAYDEIAVMQRLVAKGEKVIKAHLKHLHDEKQDAFLQAGINYLKEIQMDIELDFRIAQKPQSECHTSSGGGCPGSRSMSFTRVPEIKNPAFNSHSALEQWPIQLHLVSPHAPYMQGADLLLAADCVAFSLGNFHQSFLKGRKLAIACPKLDHDKQVYVDKLTVMIDESKINTLTVMIMEVPCCGGLLQIAQMALQNASRKIPLKLIVVGLQGEIQSEEWM